MHISWLTHIEWDYEASMVRWIDGTVFFICHHFGRALYMRCHWVRLGHSFFWRTDYVWMRTLILSHIHIPYTHKYYFFRAVLWIYWIFKIEDFAFGWCSDWRSIGMRFWNAMRNMNHDHSIFFHSSTSVIFLQQKASTIWRCSEAWYERFHANKRVDSYFTPTFSSIFFLFIFGEWCTILSIGYYPTD